MHGTTDGGDQTSGEHTDTIAVLLIDDDPMVLATLQSYVATAEDINVVATGNAFGATTRTEPHVSGLALLEDSGKGCDPAQLRQKDGGSFGLMSIRERLHGLGGTFETQGFTTRGGCRVTLRIPLESTRRDPSR